jgi:hypothetical protein
MITIFADFRQFSPIFTIFAENTLAFFLYKTRVLSKIFGDFRREKMAFFLQNKSHEHNFRRFLPIFDEKMVFKTKKFHEHFFLPK